MGNCHLLLAWAETFSWNWKFPTFPSVSWNQPYFKFSLRMAQTRMEPLKLSGSAGWKGCMRARFIFPQPHWCSPAEPTSQLPPTWPSHSSSGTASHLMAAHCVNVPSVCFASGRDDFHPPAVLIHTPVLSLSQILGMEFIYYLAIPGINLSFLSVSQQFCFYLTRYSISCFFFSLVFFMRCSSVRLLNVFGLSLHFLTFENFQFLFH